MPSSSIGSVLAFAEYAVIGGIAVIFLIAAVTNVWWSLHAWRSPAVHASIGDSQAGAASGPAGDDAGEVSFSAIVPFRHEVEFVVRETVSRLLRQRGARVELILSVGHDDPDSVALGTALARENPDRITLSVDSSSRKNKPQQLNTALARCTGTYVAIFDAESLTHPDLCRHAAAVLGESGCDVLQAGVQLVNHRTTWFSLRNCMEYYFWFRSRLHLHARHGFIPLGGNTVFVRRDLLREVGGWDQSMLTEDCDLGVTLSARGVSVAVSYDPALVTREETPNTLRALIKQRSRWNQGFLQVLSKGDWRRLPSWRQRLLAVFTLIQPYIQALTFLVLPISITAAIWSQLPLALTMLAFLPLIPLIGSLLFELAVLREFGAVLDLPVGLRDYVVLVVTLVPYQLVLGYAAARAAIRYVRGDHSWEKTAHLGSHLRPATTLDVAA